MAKQRIVNTKFWDDTYIINLDPIEKLLFLYLLTNPLTNLSGIYEINIKRISFDIGIDKDMVLKILDRFKDKGKVYYINNWIYLRNFQKNQSLNPSIIKGIERELDNVPNEIRGQIDDINRQAVTGCTQTGLPNLTKPNLTKPNLTKPILAKKEKEKTDLEEVSIEKMIDIWNGVEAKYNFLIYKGRKESKAFEDLKELWNKIQFGYSKEDINNGLINYCKEIEGRKSTNEGYLKHRFSLYEFLKQGNGLKKYCAM